MSDEIKAALCRAANHIVVFGGTARMTFPQSPAHWRTSVSFPAEAVPAVARHYWEADEIGNVLCHVRCDCGRRQDLPLQMCSCGCGVVGTLMLSDLITAFERENGLYGILPNDRFQYSEQRWEWDFDETTLWTVFDTIKSQPGQDRKFYHGSLRKMRQPLSMIHFIYILDELLDMEAIQQTPIYRSARKTVGFVPDADPSHWPEFPLEWSYIS